jgi:hypothetical protein
VPDKRQSVRHEVALAVQVRIEGTSYDSQIANLSLGGALIQLDHALPMDQRVVVTFAVPTQKEPISVGASVRWATGSAIGVQFDGLRAREVWSLNKFFESLG